MSLAKNPRSLVFFAAYPGPGNLDGASRSLVDGTYLLRHLKNVLVDDRFQAVELTSIKQSKLRKQVVELVRASGKTVAFHAAPVQWVNEENLIDAADIASLQESHRVRAMARIRGLIDEAAEYGAKQVFLWSGRRPDGAQPYDDGSDGRHRLALEALRQSLRVLAKDAHSRGQRLALMLCDAGSPDPGIFRHSLIGPAHLALEVLEPLRGEGHANLGLALDTGRLRLNGEGADVVASVAPFLDWVHISNAVGPGGDPTRRGDTSPRFGVRDSLVNDQQLAEFTKALADVGYRGPLGLSVRPMGSEVPEHVVNVGHAMLQEAADTVDVAYSLPSGYAFRARDFLTEEFFAELTEVRCQQPDVIRDELAKRKRRAQLAPDGRLVILAADHPARGVTRVGTAPAAMGHRLDYLSRIVRCLAVSRIDGLMATSDLIDEVVLVNFLVKQRGGADFLAEKVLIGSMNRTGLAGTEHEMMDRTSSYMTGKRIKEMHLDGAKLLWRWVPGGEKNDRYALETLERVAKAVEECAELNLPAFVEPLPVVKTETGYKTDLSTDNIIKAVGIASGLGFFTGRVWLKIPYCADFARVAKATTMPVLLLGGESTGRPADTIEDFVRGMGAGPNIRGALVGRNVIFAGQDDPATIAQAIYHVVHERLSSIDAIHRAAGLRQQQPHLV